MLAASTLGSGFDVGPLHSLFSFGLFSLFGLFFEALQKDTARPSPNSHQMIRCSGVACYVDFGMRRGPLERDEIASYAGKVFTLQDSLDIQTIAQGSHGRCDAHHPVELYIAIP